MTITPDVFEALIPVIALLVFVGLFFWLRPRRFYFVRHGETILNAEHVRQGAEGGLSELGKLQADRAGKHLSRYPIRRIVSSTFERARETATIINLHLKAPIVYSDVLVERRNPSEIIGKPSDNPAVMHIVDEIDRAYHDDSFRYSDEENFEDLRKRAHEALSLLSRQGARHTCVVTHSIFLKMVIAFMLYRRRLHAADYVKLSFFNASDNASITVCEYNPWLAWNATRGWKVVTYNETP